MSHIFSGVQPTNNLHIGNYLGAIKNWVELAAQPKNDCIFCVVDLHALTVYQKPEILHANILAVAKTYIALGVDPNKSIIFVQSQVKEHAELAWVLNTIAKMGELERMTQFKDKANISETHIVDFVSDFIRKNKKLYTRLTEIQDDGEVKKYVVDMIRAYENFLVHKSNLGLFAYPVLMAADILLYDTNFVPVGEDQKQHVELARDLAERFNKLYGDTFVVPELMIKKDGARVMGLDDPSKKMSKSAASANNYISLMDAPAVARKKIMKAVTDSGSEVKGGADKPALNNLLTIYSLLSGVSVKDLEKQYAGKGYGDFKTGLADEVEKFLVNFQNKFNAISDKGIEKVLTEGAGKARQLAVAKINLVKNKIGTG
ncbi:MAG: tryptophan--tRNA ligase [Candidatus Magasanikbacteria bacterium RIFOXYD2_FULL_41_14]|uniref:Tryptophan--tRNA ligase n=1 Tax=Candidatus Magasanikbacteria bacterium RIFOXYD2_FULL_41_14 TaxID=1798709 RepID=A0A1F6PBW2_9BACT|nr:MAG: tryptophan--tRNA ligase [Candidatus Magasanikbacteria bacterium RIFOXYD2_FULL_41_14]